MDSENSFHNDLKIAIALVYDKCGWALSNPKMGAESLEYGACSFKLNGKLIQHRVAKITPTKTGQFVTVWKRDETGITQPFSSTDDIDFFIITSRDGNNMGQFIFPKSVLADKGIITSGSKPGKLGVRVYPPWSKVNSKQAEKTQSWQVKYFLPIHADNITDLGLANRLLTKNSED